MCYEQCNNKSVAVQLSISNFDYNFEAPALLCECCVNTCFSALYRQPAKRNPSIPEN